MRKAIVISLLVALVSIQTPLHEVFKLPILVTHFFEHKEQNKDMSLIDFLKLHYTENTIDADHDKDMKLPFKHCSAPMFIVSTAPTNKISIDISPSFIDIPQVTLEYKNSFLSSNIQNNIWQPPKTI